MSTCDEDAFSDAQYRSIQAGLRIVGAWAGAERDPEATLARAIRREDDPADVVVGLATIARLLALELAVATGADEATVLDRLAAQVQWMRRSTVPLAADR